MDYKRSLEKFVSLGVELNAPVNLIPPGKFPFLKNVRSYQGGRLGPRQGFAKLSTSALADPFIHTLARMNDYLSVDFIRFVGAADKLYAGTAAFTEIDSGFSFDYMNIIPFRPDQSDRDWAYISNTAKQVKVSADLTKYRVGVVPPTAVPAIYLKQPSYAFIYAMDNAATWSAQGIASGVISEEQLMGAVTGVIQTDGSTGWVSVVPGSGGVPWNIGTYDLCRIGGTPVIIENLCHTPEPTNITTIASEITDASGESLVQPAQNIRGIKRDTLLQLGGSYAWVRSTILDNKQVAAFRASTPFGTTGTTITVPTTSFRIPDYGLSGSIEKHSIGARFTGPGTGSITTILGTPGYNLGSTNDGRSIGPNDYITFSVYAAELSRIAAIRVLLDIDPGTTTVDQVGTKNAFYVDLTPEDFDGNYAWKTFRIRVADWIRVGGDTGCSINSIPAVQLRVITPSTMEPGDAVDVKLGSIYSSGTYGPDTATNLVPFQYRYRYRSSATGARSLPGPALESGIIAQRQGVYISMVQSTDPQVDKIDIERLGGSNDGWHYIGTVDNGTSPLFLDGQSSEEILTVDPLEIDRYATFPINDIPYTATVNVAGTLVQFVSGPVGGFNVNWSRGTEVIVNGVRTVMESAPDAVSGTFLVADSLGGLQNVEIDIASPIKAGTPMPQMWGPFFNSLFGCGDRENPGTLYFTNDSDPDSASTTANIEITTPSEIMMNGCLFEGRNYAWSDKRMFSILPINNPNTPEFRFQYTEVPSARGLWAPRAFCVGSHIWYLGPDGIYETDGGAPVLITRDIQPLFPQGENPGFVVRGMQPVNMSPGTIPNPRLTYHNGFVYFDYVDTAGVKRAIVYDVANKAWYPDFYFEGSSPARAITARFSEYGVVNGSEIDTLLCGTSDGFVCIAQGTSDAEFPISCQIDTGAKDFGDSRAKKIYGEIVPELNTNGVSVTLTPYADNYETTLPAGSYINSQQQILPPIDLSGGIGVFARNLGVRITWSSSTAQPEIYSWEPSYLERPEDTFLRADDWGDGGYEGSKFITGFLVMADTEGVDKTVELDCDQQTVQSYTMNHPGQTVKVYSVKPQFIGTLLRLRPTEGVAWREFKVSYIFEKYPELSDLVTPYTDGGYQGAKLFRGVDIEALGGPAVTEIEVDGGVQKYSLTLDHSGIAALHTKPYAFRPPFIATEARLNPAGAIRLGKVKWIFDPYPDYSPLITPYTDGGYNGAKFVQGFKLEAAGTGSITIDYDGDTPSETFDVDHSDTDGVGVLVTKAYSLNNPIIAHELRLHTNPSTGNLRIGKIEWVFEPAPEMVMHWVSQGTAHGIPGYQFIKDGYIAHQSTADLILSVILKGVGTTFTFTIPNSGGVYKKDYILLGTGVSQTLKDKLFQYRLDSEEGFRLFKRDCEIRLHAWEGGDYMVKQPFGDVSTDDGARI